LPCFSSEGVDMIETDPPSEPGGRWGAGSLPKPIKSTPSTLRRGFPLRGGSRLMCERRLVRRGGSGVLEEYVHNWVEMRSAFGASPRVLRRRGKC
jgi:hypothetical protein